MENSTHQISTDDSSSDDGRHVQWRSDVDDEKQHNQKPKAEKSTPEEAVALVKGFLEALRQSRPHSKKDLKVLKDLEKRRKERKRAVNRNSARRKRIRQKELLQELARKCEELESLNIRLKNDNVLLSQSIDREQKKRAEHLKHYGGSMPPPDPVLPQAQEVLNAPASLHQPGILSAVGQMIQPPPQQPVTGNNLNQITAQTTDLERLLAVLVQISQAEAQEKARRAQQEEEQRKQELQMLTALLGTGLATAQSPVSPAPESGTLLLQLQHALTGQQPAQQLPPLPPQQTATSSPATTASNEDLQRSLLALLGRVRNQSS